MKQTEQYGLNQWELSDPIRMEDFNADNARLEEILEGKIGRFQKIREFTTAAKGDKSLGMLFGVNDWSAWECVLATLDLQTTAFQEGDYFIIQVLDTSFKIDDTDFRSLKGGSFCILLFPHHNKNLTIRGFAAGNGGTPFFLRRPFEELKGVTILLRNNTLGNTTTEANTTFGDSIWNVYGIK